MFLSHWKVRYLIEIFHEVANQKHIEKLDRKQKENVFNYGFENWNIVISVASLIPKPATTTSKVNPTFNELLSRTNFQPFLSPLQISTHSQNENAYRLFLVHIIRRYRRNPTRRDGIKPNPAGFFFFFFVFTPHTFIGSSCFVRVKMYGAQTPCTHTTHVHLEIVLKEIKKNEKTKK